MASSQNNALLFGLDLSGLGSSLRAAWQDLWRWPVLAWLRPELPVRVALSDGNVVRYLAGKRAQAQPGKRELASEFEAVQLPEDVLLRRAVQLPMLNPQETVAALALEAQSQSPFPPVQLVWVSISVLATNSDRQSFELVLTSRALVQAHLEKLGRLPANGGVKPALPEVWAVAEDGAPVVMPGFGEIHRQSRSRTGFRVNVIMLVLALCLATVLAATPTFQLRLRALDAELQHRALQQKVAPLLQQREAYVRVQNQLQSLDNAVGFPTSAIKVLDIVTRALPTDTSVLTFQLHSLDLPGKPPRVQITGQTSNAAALMQHLGQQVGVRDVKAPTPALKPPGAIKESYSVEFLVDAAAQGDAP